MIREQASRAIDGEANLWAPLAETASAAFAFWNDFLALKGGARNDRPLNAAEQSHWMLLIRAISWVESRHGTGTGNQPQRDPMQCGNPGDGWWRELTKGPPPGGSRFITGRSGEGTNYYANELPAAAAAWPGFPADTTLGHLTTVSEGHRDAKFVPRMSYYWGVPYLIHKANTSVQDGRTYKCGDCSRTRLLDGAKGYNSRAEYRKAVDEVLASLGWPG